MKKIAIFGLLLTVIFTFCVFAGGQQEGSGEAVVLEWWDPDVREDWIKATQYVLDNFKEESGITIERINVGWNDIDKKMQAAAASNTLPDLAYAFHNYHSAWAFQGHTIPLDDVLNEIGRDKFYQPHLGMATVDGKTYAVPFEFHPHIVYYRKDLYDKYGLSVPKTWDEMYQNAKTIHDEEEGVYGFMVYNGPGNPYVLIDLMGANGAATFDKNGNVIIDSPETIEALEYEKKLIELSPPGSLQKSSSDLRLPFVTGQGGHMMDSTSLAGIVYSENKIDQFGAFPCPVNNGNRGAMNDYGGWVVTRQAPEKAAKQFLNFFFQEDQFMYYGKYEVIGHIPATKTVAESEEYLEFERIKPFRGIFEAAIDAAQNGVGLGMTNGPNRYTGVVRSQDIWVNMVNRMVLKGESAESVSEWAQEEIEKIKKDIDG